jgi:hypothetical protein
MLSFVEGRLSKIWIGNLRGITSLGWSPFFTPDRP